MTLKRKWISSISLIFFGVCAVYAFNPPIGGDSTHTYLSPELLGGGSSVTGGAFGTALPGELAVNPSLGAGEQRSIIDASYAALVGTGDDPGIGHIVNLGALYPARWGVIAGSLNFLTSSFDSLPLGTMGSLHTSVSKDLTDKLYVGAGLSAATGSGWGVSGDLGMLYKIGTVGLMKDSKFGFSLTGLGRTFTPNTEGINGGTNTGYTSMVTPHTGFAATLVTAKNIKVGASIDISSPSFQNLVFDAGLEALIKNNVSLKSGWNFNLVESINSKQSYIPSFGISVNLKLNSSKSDSFLAKNGWSQSEITPTIAVKPLYNDIYAIGGGVNVRLGVKDVKPPEIIVTYPESVYISPNNDGTQDELQFPLTITDQRYVLAWSFIIEDANGTTVRTIANKEARTEMQDIKSFWKLLKKVKQGIALPEILRWDGIMDSGETAPDGKYSFYVTAEDDNANLAKTEKFTVYVDNTAPIIQISPPSTPNGMIFSPDGDGNKDVFTITQTGSPEDLWTALVVNASGATIKTISTKESAPQVFAWDGKNDSAAIVSDGVYAYRISTKDRGGNTAEAKIDNIIVDTEKPSINISIDLNAFSPNGDGIKDGLTLTPSIPVLNGLVQWEVAVKNRTGDTVRTYSGTGMAKPIIFDGYDNSAKRIAEGDYQAIISAKYVNGFAPIAKSPFFNNDITAPEAQVRSSLTIFSPVGDGKLDTVTFSQQTSAETAWTGQIYALENNGAISARPVKNMIFGSTPEAKAIWDGRDDSGKLAPDGQYAYRLTSTDKAGNTGISNLAQVELNTEKADLILQQNISAFSPNGDSVKDSIVFTPILKATTAIDNYALTIKTASGTIVKTIAGKGKIPQTLTWNGIADAAAGTATGTRAPDGIYNAALEVTLVNLQTSRSTAPDFEIDTKFPTIEISSPYILFSPNGDANRDTIPLTQISSNEDLWTATILTPKKEIIRNYTWNGLAGNFAWDATDDSGNKVGDGAYTYQVQSEDKAGNRTIQQLTGITIDSRTPKAYLTAELAAFSPNGDSVKDIQKFSIVASLPEGLASWSLTVKPEGITDGNAPGAKLWDSTQASVLPSTINWDGKNNSGSVVSGKYIAELTLTYLKGDKVTSVTPAFLLNAKAPTLNVKLTPKYFSPDNDGNDDEQFINLTAESASPFKEWSFEIREPQGSKGNVFWKTGGTGKITERIIWDGRSLKGELVQAATDYPFTFTVTDDVGMTSVVRGYIPIDVLIIRDGDKLKIAVPSIIFRENAADFNGLNTEVVDKNVQVLKRIAEILNKFRDYKIQVEGHANNVTGTQKEEEKELIPLSLLRADAVKAFLVQNGVDISRLSSIGMGGTKPVAQRADYDNWWKNRRVEFVLIK